MQIDFGDLTLQEDCFCNMELKLVEVYLVDYAGPSPLNSKTMMIMLLLHLTGDAVDFGDSLWIMDHKPWVHCQTLTVV